ncbi:YqzE family protein [Halobacillus sp. A1]|uniref:YqzE family protein n=1 Tax=Halobacillus sp. A1 TaxID=2880262 RepID=UPI0020A69F0B|nr:YqzE family protein [Halobacillus sp. A1]MCP3030296.1 YqzE family protein [Halobacillus sp. A1]
MKKSEYAQYLTEEMMKHMHMTKEEKLEKKHSKPSKKSSSYWFGVIPFALRMLRKKRKK